MRLPASLLAVLAGSALLAGCSSFGDATGELRSNLGTDNFVRNGDTYGTQRRVDVYGGSTAPSLPTMGATGFGK